MPEEVGWGNQEKKAIACGKLELWHIYKIYEEATWISVGQKW